MSDLDWKGRGRRGMRGERPSSTPHHHGQGRVRVGGASAACRADGLPFRDRRKGAVNAGMERAWHPAMRGLSCLDGGAERPAVRVERFLKAHPSLLSPAGRAFFPPLCVRRSAYGCRRFIASIAPAPFSRPTHPSSVPTMMRLASADPSSPGLSTQLEVRVLLGSDTTKRGICLASSMG